MTGSSPEWEERLAALWASIDERSEAQFLARMEELAAELPADSAVAAFERASALDSTGHSDLAVPLYLRALELRLQGERRRRAVIQLASSLRNLGRAPESVALLRAERERVSDDLDDAVGAFLALALADTGREREALSLVLTALARHLPRYQRSLANYAQKIAEPPPATETRSPPVPLEKPEIDMPEGDIPFELGIDDLVVGDGDEAVSGKKVTVHYVGVSFTTGEEFDASWNRGQPFEFKLGKGQVIPGWDAGVQGMKVGGRRKLTIPSALAYGARGAGGVIKPHEPLVFVVDLLSVD